MPRFRNYSKQPFIIGVAGGSASGKTSVCNAIIERVQRDHKAMTGSQASASVTILTQDLFYRDLTKEEMRNAKNGNFNFDHPNAFDFELFEDTLRQLATGEPHVKVPTYSYVKNSRTGTSSFKNSDVIIVEGILALYSQKIRTSFDLKIFVDSDDDVRLIRRILRDTQERGRTVTNILTQYQTHVKPTFEEFQLPTKKFADIIVPHGKTNYVAINLIAQHIIDLLVANKENG